MNYRILVVDDEPDNIQLVRRTLRRHYDIVTANNADEAIEVLKNDADIEMVLSDHKMPGKSRLVRCRIASQIHRAVRTRLIKECKRRFQRRNIL